MKFLLQQGVLLDFVFAMQKAKEWWDWWKPKSGIVEFVDSGCSKEICPIGSLEFCLDYYKNLGITLEPMNVPLNLFEYSIGATNGSRKVPNFPDWIKELEDTSFSHFNDKNRLIDHPWMNGGFYLKSETKFKYPGNGVYNSVRAFIESEYYDPSDRYQITSVDSNLSDEWRYFVFDGKVVGCKCYLPDDIMSPEVPDKDWVLDKVKKIDLPAFTLDIVMGKPPRKTPRIVEVHDFFSCGLYGFDDYKVLPYMFYRSHLHKFL